MANWACEALGVVVYAASLIIRPFLPIEVSFTMDMLFVGLLVRIFGLLVDAAESSGLISAPTRDQDLDGSLSDDNTSRPEIEHSDIHPTRALSTSLRSSSLPRQPIESLLENATEGIQSSILITESSALLSDYTSGPEIELKDIHPTRALSPRSSSMPRQPTEVLLENVTVTEGIQSSIPITGKASIRPLLPDCADNNRSEDLEIGRLAH